MDDDDVDMEMEIDDDFDDDFDEDFDEDFDDESSEEEQPRQWHVLQHTSDFYPGSELWQSSQEQQDLELEPSSELPQSSGIEPTLSLPSFSLQPSASHQSSSNVQPNFPVQQSYEHQEYDRFMKMTDGYMGMDDDYPILDDDFPIMDEDIPTMSNGFSKSADLPEKAEDCLDPGREISEVFDPTYVKITVPDGYAFILKRHIANISKALQEFLKGPDGQIVNEVFITGMDAPMFAFICKFLMFKNHYSGEHKYIPEFVIPKHLSGAKLAYAARWMRC